MVLGFTKKFKCKNESEMAVETIYFGGGTPSVLTSEEIDF
jgi:oxygen-independent coproporphyrinogen-3 oxidase